MTGPTAVTLTEQAGVIVVCLGVQVLSGTRPRRAGVLRFPSSTGAQSPPPHVQRRAPMRGWMLGVGPCLTWVKQQAKPTYKGAGHINNTLSLSDQPAWSCSRAATPHARLARSPNMGARARSCMNIAALGCGALLDFFRVRLRHGLRIAWLPPDALLNDGSRLLLACALAALFFKPLLLPPPSCVPQSGDTLG